MGAWYRQVRAPKASAPWDPILTSPSKYANWGESGNALASIHAEVPTDQRASSDVDSARAVRGASTRVARAKSPQTNARICKRMRRVRAGARGSLLFLIWINDWAPRNLRARRIVPGHENAHAWATGHPVNGRTRSVATGRPSMSADES